jgi:hypothetical protein
MGVIAFSDKPEEIWAVAGWAFRQILDDTASEYPEDSEMAGEFEVAKAITGLQVCSLRPDLRARVTARITAVAQGILSGSIRSGIVDKPYGDDATIAEYRKGLLQLLEAIPPQTASG